ncbi:MAG: C40 family peptidase [Desulfobacterales bacterium]|nr:C40 family peptidase [Desulfobacterales bacterium]
MKKTYLIFLLVCLLLFSACAKKQVYDPSQDYGYSSGKYPVQVKFSKNEIRKLLDNQYAEWKGVPHKMGGYSKSGIDCSGFTNLTYKELFRINLPRTTATLASVGIKIDRQFLTYGDLVFFKPPSYPRHVGIYIGNNKFIHASFSKGVMMSDMSVSYWKNHYWMSRKVIEPQ